MCFYRSYGFICDFLEFFLMRSSKIFSVYWTWRDTIINTEKVEFEQLSFFIFANLSFSAEEKLVC